MRRRGNLKELFLPAVLSLVLLFGVLPGHSHAFSPETIEVQPQVLDPVTGGQAAISFYLRASARVTTRVFDANHFLVKILEDRHYCPTGMHTVIWDGTDNYGLMVPAEAYYFTVGLVFDDGSHVLYNPAFSGGKYLGTIYTQVDKQKGGVRYHLPEPGRIRIRAGIQRGPLRKTILDWAPTTGGDHIVAWDGKDESGAEIIWNKDGFVLNASAFALPPHSIIVARSELDYFDYWTERARKEDMEMFEYMRLSEDARAALRRARDVTEKALSNTQTQISNYYLMNRFTNRPPDVTMKLEGEGVVSGGDIPILRGRVGIKVLLSELTQKMLLQQRYEVIFYVDDVLTGEDESGYSPYTWLLDTSVLENGPHTITVNIATLSDQVGSWSQKVMVSN